MGWDDAPPDPDLVAKADWTAAPPDPDLASDYWGDVKKHAQEGIKQWPQAAEAMGGQALKIGRAMLPGQMIQSGTEFLGGKPALETPVGQGAKALYDVGKGAVGGAWQGIKDTGSLAKAPFEMMGGTPMAQTEIGEKFRERPLSVPAGVVGTVAPAVSAFKVLRGAGAGAGLAEEATAGIPKRPPVGPAVGKQTFYHVTPDPESVIKSGLIPEMGEGTGEPGHVYMTKDLNRAKAYLDQLKTDVDTMAPDVGANPRIVKVELPEDFASKIIPDPEDVAGGPDVMFKGSIPKEFISDVESSNAPPSETPAMGGGRKLPGRDFMQDPDVLEGASTFRAAVRGPDGKIHVGDLGEPHRGILYGLEIPDEQMDAYTSGFYDTITKKFITGEQLADNLGLPDKYKVHELTGDDLEAMHSRIGTGSTAGPPPPGQPPPGTETPPPPGGGTPPPQPDPMQEVRDYIAQKYGEQAAKPGMIQGAGRYLQNLSQELGTKDIGMQPRQIQSMGPGFQGLEKAEALVDYARGKGYFSPTLTDLARKTKIKQVMEQTGQQVEAVRSVADTRGVPPLAEMRNQLTVQLKDKFGIDAPQEIKRVLQKFDKAAKKTPTFSGMADLATELNKAKTPANKMGQHPGPTTDAANIISRLNNDAIRSVLNPKEAETYTNSLRDFGAHKKLEQAVAAAGRRSASARTNQRGILGRLFQGALDRGGYRIAGNITHKLGTSMVESPAKFKTMPQFFEELAHESGDVLDELSEGPQFAHGGIVQEMDDYLTPKYGGTQ